MPKFYALLIGINYYESVPTYPRLYKNLGGCVRDIDLVDSYLRKTLEIPSEQIWKLTAPVEESNELAKIRADRGNILPTYANIVQAFAEITAAADSDDQVYIHYSGHGGRAITIYPELQGENREDESIVPMDIIGNDGRYLRDVEIATLLKRITDKGCITTVIFDSCHSGGATRGDCAIRGNENNEIDGTPRSQESLVASREELIENWRILTQADPELTAGWLPNADDYVFLAACRPSEFAYEYAVNGGERNGALTYWMMDTLTSTTSVLTYKSLYSRVKGMIQSKFPQQLPMLTGNSDREVFGDKRKYKPYTVTVTQVDLANNEITLEAGLAQGLSKGTRFAIYPFNFEDLADKTQQIAIVELTDDIEAGSSTAKIIDAVAGGIKVKEAIQPGASAVMIAAPIDLIRKVRLFDRKVAGEQEQDLPADLANKQTAALAKVREALIGNGWVVEAEEDEEGYYQVAVAKDDTYEICSGMPIENLRPALSIDDPEAPQKVVDRLIHLTKYQSVRALDNPASELSEYLEFQLCDRNKQPFPDPQNVSLKPGEVTYLRVKNTYAKTLNVAVLDLEPTWEISQVPIEGDFSSFFPLNSGQEAYTKLRLALPDNYKHAQETLKIFATKGAANFQWLTLPSLDEQTQTRGNNLNKQLITRSGERSINPLNDLLTTIGNDVNHPPEKTRAMVYEPDPEAEWETQEIKITVAQNLADLKNTFKTRGRIITSRKVSNIEVPVYFATDRERKETNSKSIKISYGGDRNPKSKLEYGLATVSIPAERRMGYIQRPKWWKLEFREDVNKHIVLLNLENYDREYFQTKLREDIKNSIKPELLLFIHGYSVSFHDAVLRTAQISHDLEFEAPAILYSWPSAARKEMYISDGNNVEWTIPHLKEFLQFLLTTVGAKSVSAIAHSMGNRALARAIKESDFSNLGNDAASLRHIIFAAPDIDAGIFEQLARNFATKADSFTLYASSNDKALQVSKAVNGNPRAGDSGKDLVIVDGVDTIDASSIDTGFMGHSYFGDNRSVISDIFYLLKQDLPPNQRACLDEMTLRNLTYWLFKA